MVGKKGASLRLYVAASMLILSTLAHSAERTFAGSLICRVASQADRTLACIFEPLDSGGNRAYSASISDASMNLPPRKTVTVWSVFAARQRPDENSRLSGTYTPTVSSGSEALIGGLRNRFVLLRQNSAHGPPLEIKRMVLRANRPRA